MIKQLELIRLLVIVLLPIHALYYVLFLIALIHVKYIHTLLSIQAWYHPVQKYVAFLMQKTSYLVSELS